MKKNKREVSKSEIGTKIAVQTLFYIFLIWAALMIWFAYLFLSYRI